MVEQRAMIPEANELAMVAARRFGDRDQLGLAGAAAGQREHQRRRRGQHALLAVLGALDVGTQALVVADGDLRAIFAERSDGVEMMIAAKARGAIARDHFNQELVLNFFRFGGEALPACPLAFGQECGGFQQKGHDILAAHFVLGAGEAFQGVVSDGDAEAARLEQGRAPAESERDVFEGDVFG